MTDDSSKTSPCKGEVDREASGWGSRFSRTKDMTARARSLRANMTDAESRLWRALRRDQLNGLSFRKQHPIGPYTVDFYCARLHLAVEVDGGQHAEQRKAADDRRTQWLAEKGVTVVRYWNNDVLSNLEGVLSDLVAHTERLAQAETTPTPTLPLSGGGGGERSPSHLPLKRGGRFAQQRKPGGDQLSPHAPVPGADPHPTLPLSGGGGIGSEGLGKEGSES